ncbi:MAG: histidine kinase [Propionibacteriaceae bacterium]|nr:histidine kinase [Propionibacteriaceae bacterium]
MTKRARIWGGDPESPLTSLLFSVPFLVFLAFPVVAAVRAGLHTVAGMLLLVETMLLAAVYCVSWLVNPVVLRNQHGSPAFWATTLGLLALQIAMLVTHWQAGMWGGAFIMSYVAVAWVLQSPARLLVPGCCVVMGLVIAQVLIHPPEGILPIVVTALAGATCLLTRRTIEAERVQALEMQRTVLLSREHERSRLSADLHDVLGQTLVGITVKADLTGRLLDAGRSEAARDQVDELTELARTALADIRAVVAANRTLLPETEIDQAAALTSAAGIRLEVIRQGAPPPGAPSTLTAHVIREGVTNALKHAVPSWIVVELTDVGVKVTNDGLSAAQTRAALHSGTGLAGLKERVAEAGTLRWGPAASGDKWAVELVLADVLVEVDGRRDAVPQPGRALESGGGNG